MEVITHKSERPEIKPVNVSAKFALICSNVGVMRCPFDRDGNILDGLWLNEVDLATHLATLLESVTGISNSPENRTVNAVKSNRQFISERVLFENSDAIVWYSESNMKIPQFYSTVLSPVPHPQLVFFVSKAKQRLSVIATKESGRPSLSSTIFHAPLANLYTDTHLCLGTAFLPKERSSNNIVEIEDCLLRSRYSGFKFDCLNLTDTDYVKPFDLWNDLQLKESFPLELLKPVNEADNLEEWVTLQMSAVGGNW